MSVRSGRLSQPDPQVWRLLLCGKRPCPEVLDAEAAKRSLGGWRAEQNPGRELPIWLL
jgi:hypothetical protein